MTTGDAVGWHVVSVEPTETLGLWRLDCAPGCDGPDPHMHGELVDDTADLDGHA